MRCTILLGHLLTDMKNISNYFEIFSTSIMEEEGMSVNEEKIGDSFDRTDS